MGRKKFDYRKYYKDYFVIDFDDDMVVHHIDFDRRNNTIDNLLLMPKQLHAKYHFAVCNLGGTSKGIFDGNIRVPNKAGTHKAWMFKMLADSLMEIEKWSYLKDQLEIARHCQQSYPMKITIAEV